MDCLPQNAAATRYRNRFLVTMGVYVAVLLSVSMVVRHLHPTGPLAYLLATLPALPILAVLAIVAMYLTEETDEFQRNLLIHSMLIAIGLTLATTTVWGFLEIFAGIPHFLAYLAFPLFWFFVGVSTPLLKLKYR